MDLSTSELFYLVGEAATILSRGAPGLDARLTPHGSLVLTGEPYADFNHITIGAGPAPETQLREFYGVAEARSLPCLVLLTEAEAERLAPTAGPWGSRPQAGYR